MKANIETLEPVIRPAAVKPVAKPVRALRLYGFTARPAPALFHAWRA